MSVARRLLDQAVALRDQKQPALAHQVTALSIAAALVGIEEHLGTLARIEQERWDQDSADRSRR